MKRICRLALGCLAMAGAWLPIQAERISEGEARQVAERFFNDARLGSSHPTAKAGKAEQFADYYVFNRGQGEGFVIVAGDDEAQAILGYSHQGTLDYDQAPAQLKAWLDGYAQEMRWLREQTGTDFSGRQAGEQETFTPVQPLLGDIAWDQLEPYNGMTPCYVGTTHSATGCVATAMAQIMYYHRWPERGTGSHYYTPVGWNKEIGADFSQSVYDWDAMLPRYTADASQQSKDAVALLMRDCGIAVNMVYGAQSGSVIEEWPLPLTTYFSYDKGVGLLNRTYYTQNEWDAIIRAEIEAGRPVFSTGFTESSGGHAYVFDGYDADGLIHVNWGWSGMANGYFRTSALMPSIQGTGGSVGGFNYKQSILVGIQPPTESSEQYLQIVSSERMKAEPAACGQDEPVTLKLTGKVTNYGWQAVTVDFGIGVFDAAGTLLSVMETDKNALTLAVEDYIIGLSTENVSFSSLPDGQYEVRPVARNTGGTRWTMVRNFNYKKNNRLDLKVQEGQLLFSSPEAYRLEADSLYHTELYRNTAARIMATVANRGGLEYSGGIRAALLDVNGTSVMDESVECTQSILPGASASVEVIATFTVAAGTYKLTLLDDDSQQLCTPVEVTLQEMPEEGVLQMDEALSFPDNEKVLPDSMALTARLTCTQGVFAGELVIYLYDASGTTMVGGFEPQFVFAQSGDKLSVHFTATFENGVPGTTYRAVLTDAAYGAAIQPADLATCTFTLAGDASGLPAIQGTVPADGVVYTLQGIPVRRDGSLEGLPAGLYIMNREIHIAKQ